MTTLPSGTPIAANQPKGALSAISVTTTTTATIASTGVSISTQVELTDSAVYREVLEINPIRAIHAIRAIGGSHHLRVRSQLDTARDPEAWHLRYRVTLDTAGLERLHQALGAYLQAVGSNQTPGGRS